MIYNKEQLTKDLVNLWKGSTTGIYMKHEIEDVLVIRHLFSSAEAVTRMGDLEYHVFITSNVVGGSKT